MFGCSPSARDRGLILSGGGERFSRHPGAASNGRLSRGGEEEEEEVDEEDEEENVEEKEAEDEELEEQAHGEPAGGPGGRAISEGLAMRRRSRGG